MRASADRSTRFVEGDAVVLLELDGGLGTIGYVRLIEATRGVVLLVVRTSAGDVATACGDVYDALIDDRLRHRGQGALDAAVAGAGTRPNGDAWAWGRSTSTVDISPLVAVTLARWALVATPPAQPAVH